MASVKATGESRASNHWLHGGTEDTGPSLCEKSRVYSTTMKMNPQAIAPKDTTLPASSAAEINDISPKISNNCNIKC